MQVLNYFERYCSVVNQYVKATICLFQIIVECQDALVVVDIELMKLRLQTLTFQFADSTQTAIDITSCQIHITIVLLAKSLDDSKTDTFVPAGYLYASQDIKRLNN